MSTTGFAGAIEKKTFILFAPMAQLGTSKTFNGRVVGQNVEVTRPGISCHIFPDCGERLCGACTTFDFTVDKKKEPLNPSRDGKERQAPQEEGGGPKLSPVRLRLMRSCMGWTSRKSCICLSYNKR